MQNTLEDLNNHLFAELERLDDEELSPEELDKELKRADGITKVATSIIQNGELAYRTMSLQAEYSASYNIPRMLEIKHHEQ